MINNPSTALPAHANRSGLLRAFSLVVAGLTLLSANLCADTAITDPSGDTLAFGRSLLRVNLSPAYSASATNAPGGVADTTCLLVGRIGGICAVVDPAQSNTGDFATNHWGKIYLVDLLGKGLARFSGLQQDIISMVPFTNTGRIEIGSNSFTYDPNQFFLKNIYLSAGATTKSYYHTWTNKSTNWSLLEWRNPLMTNQTNSQLITAVSTNWSSTPTKIACFSLVTETNGGIERKRMAGNTITVPDWPNPIITSIDAIDLNQWSTADNTNKYSPALIIWANTNVNSIKGNDRVFPNTVYVLNQDTNSGDFSIRNTIPLPTRSYYDWNRYYTNDGSVHGGALVAPAGLGGTKGLGYYFCQNYVNNAGATGNRNYGYHLDSWMYRLGIYFDNEGKIYLSGQAEEIGRYNLNNANGGNKWKPIDYTIVSEDLGYYEFGGPRIEVTGPFGGTNKPPIIRLMPSKISPLNFKKYPYDVTNAVIQPTPSGADDDIYIGVLSPVPQQALSDINDTLAIKGGNIPENIPARLVRYYQTRGTKVRQVFLGWPYVALQVNRDGILDSTESGKLRGTRYTSEKATVTMTNDSYNSGISTAFQVGVGGKGKLVEWGVGIKSMYQSSVKNDIANTVSFTDSTAFSADDISNFSQGFVTYSELYPTISSLAYVCGFDSQGGGYYGKPTYISGSLRTNITVFGFGGQGGTNWQGNTNFFFPQLSMGEVVGEDGAGVKVSFQSFLLEDPSRVPISTTYKDKADYSSDELSFTSTNSALTEGLVAKNFGSFIAVTNAPATNGLPKINQWTKFASLKAPIKQWQASNNLVADLEQFKQAKAGVNYVNKTASLVSSFNVGQKYVSTYAEDTKQTATLQQSLGVWWDVKPSISLGPVTKGEINYNAGESFETSEKKSNTRTFEFPVAKSSLGAAERRAYYFYTIDVPALKSYMATHTYTLNTGTPRQVTYTNVAVRPNFIPIWCWNNNQNYEFGFPWLP